MKKYLRRRPRHFFIFTLFFFICFFRTDLLVRILRGGFLFPLTVSDYLLLGCDVFILFFLYITAAGYRFEEKGCAKKYPFLKEKFYPAEMMSGYRVINGAVTIWCIFLKGKKEKKLLLPDYIPGMQQAVEEFLQKSGVPRIS